MKKATLLLIWIVFIANQLFANGFSTLKMGSDARTTGMGLAGSALAEGGAAPFWNPANAAVIHGSHLELSLHRWMDDVKSEFAGIVSGNGKQGIGFYILFTDLGRLEHRLVPSETPLGTFSAHELNIALAYSHQLISNLYLGFSAKAYYEKIYTADTWGFGGDIGLLYQTSFYNLQVAGVAQNLGKTAKFQNESIPLPFTGRLGIMLPIQMNEGTFLFVCDGIKEDGYSVHIHTGTEYCWKSILSLRAGMQTGYETRNLTGGLGIIHNQLRLDYSYLPMSALGDSHRFSFGFSW